MKKYTIIIAVLLSIFMIACGGETSKPNTSSPSAQKANAPDGKKLYKTYCITCHGIYGDSQINNAKNFKESTLTLEERILVIKNGRNTMQAFGAIMSDEKIKAVAEYTMTFK